MKVISGLSRIILISILIMLVISSTALLHANEAEFILDRFEGVSTFSFSLFDSVLYASYLIFGPIAGLLSARKGKRKLFVLIGSAGTALSTLLMTFAGNYPLLLLLRFLQGMFCVSAWQTLMTMILDLSDRTNRGRNMGIFGTFMSLAMGLGPVAGGALAGISLFAPYYSASIQCTAAAIICLLFISEPPVKVENIKPSVIDSILFARKRPGIIVPAMFNLVDRLHMGFIIFMIPLMLRELMDLGPEFRGMLLGINGLPFIMLQYPIGRLSDRTGRIKLLLTGSIGYGVLLCLTGPVAGYGLLPLSLLFFCLGIFSGFTGPPNSALAGDFVTAEENPLAMGFFNLFGNMGMVFGSLFGGLMLSFSGFSIAFVAAGAVELATLMMNVIILRRIRLNEPVPGAPVA